MSIWIWEYCAPKYYLVLQASECKKALSFLKWWQYTKRNKRFTGRDDRGNCGAQPVSPPIHLRVECPRLGSLYSRFLMFSFCFSLTVMHNFSTPQARWTMLGQSIGWIWCVVQTQLEPCPAAWDQQGPIQPHWADSAMQSPWLGLIQPCGPWKFGGRAVAILITTPPLPPYFWTLENLTTGRHGSVLWFWPAGRRLNTPRLMQRNRTQGFHHSEESSSYTITARIS